MPIRKAGDFDPFITGRSRMSRSRRSRPTLSAGNAGGGGNKLTFRGLESAMINGNTLEATIKDAGSAKYGTAKNYYLRIDGLTIQARSQYLKLSPGSREQIKIIKVLNEESYPMAVGILVRDIETKALEISKLIDNNELYPAVRELENLNSPYFAAHVVVQMEMNGNSISRELWDRMEQEWSPSRDFLGRVRETADKWHPAAGEEAASNAERETRATRPPVAIPEEAKLSSGPDGRLTPSERTLLLSTLFKLEKKVDSGYSWADSTRIAIKKLIERRAPLNIIAKEISDESRSVANRAIGMIMTLRQNERDALLIELEKIDPDLIRRLIDLVGPEIKKLRPKPIPAKPSADQKSSSPAGKLAAKPQQKPLSQTAKEAWEFLAPILRTEKLHTSIMEILSPTNQKLMGLLDETIHPFIMEAGKMSARKRIVDIAAKMNRAFDETTGGEDEKLRAALRILFDEGSWK